MVGLYSILYAHDIHEIWWNFTQVLPFTKWLEIFNRLCLTPFEGILITFKLHEESKRKRALIKHEMEKDKTKKHGNQLLKTAGCCSQYAHHHRENLVSEHPYHCPQGGISVHQN